MDEHLGYTKHDAAGRNGQLSQRDPFEDGDHRGRPVDIDVPRDRDSSFEPATVKKRQRRMNGVDSMVISLTVSPPTRAGRAGSFERVDDGPRGVLPFSWNEDTANSEIRDTVNGPRRRHQPAFGRAARCRGAGDQGLWWTRPRSATMVATARPTPSNEFPERFPRRQGEIAMRRFKKILFSPLGKHENSLAVRNIAKLVTGTPAHLTLFGVVPTPSGVRRLLPWADLEEELQQRQRAELERQLSKWGRRVGCSSIDRVVEVGNPALSIIERVLVKDHDLVVVTTDDDREDRVTIRRLLRKCPCPVWVIRPTRARTQRVLAAVNPDPDEADLNRLIIELAASMVGLNGGELHVVHAWELFGESTLRSSAFVHASSAQIDEMLRIEHDARQLLLEQLLSLPTVAEAPWRIHLEKGPARDVVPHLAALLRINVLVMGTVARTGVRGLVMGNTAETILDQVDCSVIAVKPPGFVSPIEPPDPRIPP